jgi:hypothetical protein
VADVGFGGLRHGLFVLSSARETPVILPLTLWQVSQVSCVHIMMCDLCPTPLFYQT